MSEVVTKLHLDRSDKKIIAERVQDVEPILEHNKTLRTLPQQSDWGRHIASIPNVVIEQWLSEEAKRGNIIKWSSPEFTALIHKKINDRDWLFLRVDK